MKIAILTELFLPSVGGQEVRYAEISQVLTAHGHSVEVYCIHTDRGSEAEGIIDGAVVHRHPQAYGYLQPILRILRRRPLAVLRFALRCRSIDPKAFDCFVFNQWPIAHIFMAPRAMRAKAFIDWCEYRDGLTFGFLQKHLPRLTAANVANSIALQRDLQVCSGQRFEVLPSGIFPDRYHCAPAREREGILYLGRIEEHKNLPLMLSSYKSLLSRGYGGRLRIAGGGPALSKLQKLVKASNIAERVDLLGFVTEERKIELLASSEVFLVTSRREGFPRAIAEAMASGLPVVTVDYPENGAKDVVRQYGIGVVTDPAPSKVAEGVLRVMAEWEMYSRTGVSASRSLDWEVLIDKLLQIADGCQANGA
ncbi:MAG: glycosyltransferase family 4 protein [Candidatus Korobacteraceae bacterium]